MVKLRLMRFGRKHSPSYRIVAIDVTRKREGKALDFIGHYNPIVQPKVLNIDMEKYNEWIQKGAQPTQTVKSLVKKVSKSA